MESDIPFHKLESLDFRFYHPSEIQSLSVLEITNPQTFDTLAHPCKGGLYDAALGPVDRDDVCGTCGQNFIHCPGHMGHIQLPLPVYNPVYFPTLYQILRGSCFNCHRLTVSSLMAFVFVKKIELLNHGLLAKTGELTEFLSNQLYEHGTDTAAEEIITDQINDKVQEWLADTEKHLEASPIKNVEAARSVEISSFIYKHFMTITRRCPHCKAKKRQLKQENNVKLLLSGKEMDVQKRKKLSVSKNKKKPTNQDDGFIDNGNGNMIESQDIENMAEGAGDEAEEEGDSQEGNLAIFDSREQTYITPSQARDHFRLLWEKDRTILKYLFHSLSIGGDTDECPDIFFLEVMPVPPSRFRPVIQIQNHNKLKFFMNTVDIAIKICLTVPFDQQTIVYNPSSKIEICARKKKVDLPGSGEMFYK